MSIGTAPPAAHLQAFLTAHHLRVQDLLEQVDDVFGAPLLTVATGSVIAGYGNRNSDLDLYVAVERPVPSQVPLMAYQGGRRLDVVLFGAAELSAHEAAMDLPWPPAATGQAAISARRRRLDALSRFALGQPIQGDDGWRGWRERLGAGLPGWIISWYASEALRCAAAARWLLPRHPAAAALRAADALLHALEVRVALRGELYFKPKWLGEKLRTIGDDDGWQLFVRAMRSPYEAAACPAYVEETTALAVDLIAGHCPYRPAGRLRWATGTQTQPFGSKVLVSRWGLRTVEVDGVPAALAGEGLPVDLDTPLDRCTAALFEADLLWFGVEAVR